MKFSTEIIVWSAIGNTPLTNRSGAHCDELVRITVQCENPTEARELTKKLVRETAHGYMGYFNMPAYPNQNTRKAFTH